MLVPRMIEEKWYGNVVVQNGLIALLTNCSIILDWRRETATEDIFWTTEKFKCELYYQVIFNQVQCLGNENCYQVVIWKNVFFDRKERQTICG